MVQPSNNSQYSNHHHHDCEVDQGNLRKDVEEGCFMIVVSVTKVGIPLYSNRYRKRTSDDVQVAAAITLTAARDTYRSIYSRISFPLRSTAGATILP